MCGQYKDVLKPGLTWTGLDCCGACVTTRVITSRIMENRTLCDTKTKDNVFVRIDVSVQMQVLATNTYDAIYRLADPKAQVDSFVQDVIRGQVPTMTLDHTFAAKDDLANAVKERLSEQMNTFGYEILNSLVTDIEPDGTVKRAMNEIETSKRMRLAQETKAMADKNVQIFHAQGQAESKFLQGQGIARQRSAIIDGLRESLGTDGEAISSERVSELLLITQYFDTIKEVSQGKAATVFLPNGHDPNSVATQVRDGMMQARTASMPGQQRM